MRLGATPFAAAVLAAGASAACLARTGFVATPAARALATARGAPGDVTGIDPQSAGAILLPASLKEARFWGTESGGGQRAVVAGVRVIVRADGSLAAAAARLPGSPASVAPIPERLGGGFVYVVGSQIWRSQTWLGECLPIFTASSTIDQALVGLDRIYARVSPGGLAAIDPQSGRLRELGPLPSAPHFGQLVTLDAWRALVVADLRGVLVTADAGASWRPVAIPFEPHEVAALEDGFAVDTLDADRRGQWWLVRANGRSEPLAEAPAQSAWTPPRIEPNPLAKRIFDQHPLAVAIEDGWPLRDGTAMVARDGTLARIRTSDGAVVELTPDAFAPSPSRCHGLSLSTPSDPGAFGFVCGEPRGQTRIYAWDAAVGGLTELRRFDDPREVTACGNGSLVVAGGCGPRSEAAREGGDGPGPRMWCLMSASRTWSELRDSDPDGARAQPIVTSDGRVAWLRPPRGGDLRTARLTLTSLGGGGSSGDVAVHFGLIDGATERVLRFGTWMNGFEERRPGVLGGWIDGGGSVLGVEIDVRGEARAGEYIRDAGAPVVSGRWAMGWTASRGGFESTDGGMTWEKELSLPEPIAEPRAHTERVCGPIGCVVAGWLRVGWGARDRAPPIAPRPLRTAPGWGAPGALRLACEPLASMPMAPAVLEDASEARSHEPGAVRAGSSAVRGGWGALSEMPFFSGHAPPVIPESDLGLSAEGSDGLERSTRSTPAVELYAWGPSTGEWDMLGRWQVRWDWPWGGWSESRASAVASSPWPSLDAARRSLGPSTGSAPTLWSLVAGDDPDHALLVARHGTTAELIVLDAERAPVSVQHDGEGAFPEPQSALRSSGRWFVATAQPAADPSATVLWAIDGSIAREIHRIPRAGSDSRPDARLARRTDTRAIGLLAEGQPDLTKPVSLWLVPIDVESGAAGEPQPMGPPGIFDLPGRICPAAAEDEVAWDSDFLYPGRIEITRNDWSAPLQGLVVRLRLTRDSACIARVLGSIDPYGSSPPRALARPARGEPSGNSAVGLASAATSPSVDVSVFSARARFSLRCRPR